jgi:hypothetical protein
MVCICTFLNEFSSYRTEAFSVSNQICSCMYGRLDTRRDDKKQQERKEKRRIHMDDNLIERYSHVLHNNSFYQNFIII